MVIYFDKIRDSDWRKHEAIKNRLQNLIYHWASKIETLLRNRNSYVFYEIRTCGYYSKKAIFFIARHPNNNLYLSQPIFDKMKMHKTIHSELYNGQKLYHDKQVETYQFVVLLFGNYHTILQDSSNVTPFSLLDSLNREPYVFMAKGKVQSAVAEAWGWWWGWTPELWLHSISLWIRAQVHWMHVYNMCIYYTTVA